MSNVTIESEPFVMVRSHRGVPVKVRILTADRESAVVTGSDDGHAIGYRAQDVFIYDERLFDKIKTVCASGNAASVATLWSRAEKFDPFSLKTDMDSLLNEK
jgi:hypothetical protein